MSVLGPVLHIEALAMAFFEVVASWICWYYDRNQSDQNQRTRAHLPGAALALFILLWLVVVWSYRLALRLPGII